MNAVSAPIRFLAATGSLAANVIGGVVQGVRMAAFRFATRSGWLIDWAFGRTRIDYARWVDPMRNSIVVAVVRWVARNFPESPVRIRRLNPDGTYLSIPPSQTGPGFMLTLIERPNPYFSGVLQWIATIIDLFITGNGYWIKIRDAFDRPAELWYVPKKFMRPAWPLDGSVFISHYLYRIDGVDYRIEPRNVIHFRDGINPDNMREGQSSLAAILREIYTDDEAGNFSAQVLTNLGVPGVIIAPSNTAGGREVKVDPETIKTKFRDTFGGDGRGEPLVLSAPADIKVLSWSPEQMDLKGLRRIPEERISAVLGVPAGVAQLGAGLDRNTFCLPADARVWTTTGARRIDEVSAGDEVWSFKDGGLVARRVRHAGINGVKPIYRLRTRNRILRASGNHPVLTRVPGTLTGQSPAHAWRRMDELVAGDWIVQPKNLPDLGGEKLPTGEPATPDLLQFLGAVVGDGTVLPGIGVHMAIPPGDRVAEPYRTLAAALFTRQEHNSGGDLAAQAAVPRTAVAIREIPRSFAFSSARDSRWLAELGFGGRARSKRIPGWVFALRRDLRLSFLAGLVDTDGSIDRRGVLTFGFANRALTEDVKDLLLSVGILTSNLYRTTIGVERLPQPGRRREYEAWVIAASSAFAVSEIPFADPGYRARVNANLTRWKSSGFDAHKAGLSSDLGFYRVLAIDVAEPEPIFDLEIEGSHSFIADGVVVHNTNYSEARRAAFQEAIAPLMRLIAAELEVQLLDDFADLAAEALDVDFDTSKASALQEAVDAVWRRTESAATKGLLTRAAFKRAIGEPVDDVADDVYIIPNNYTLMPPGGRSPTGGRPSALAPVEPAANADTGNGHHDLIGAAA